MADVTVCIPAYRPAAFIRHTLASVRDQTFRDFEVEISLEPVDVAGAVAACEPFLEDSRFRMTVNAEVLGYAGNVRGLLHRVRSPLFVVLPHDDTWHPRFLERLHLALDARPDAVCAYPDLLCFAPEGQDSGVISQSISDADLPERILSWFLDGASGTPWHGLTRSTVLDRDFPTNPHRGFAVEAEWALHLVSRGRVLRVAEPLYLKRMPTTADSVSASWYTVEQDLRTALDHHREQLLLAIPDMSSPEDREAVEAAAESAMLRRWLDFANGRWGLTSWQLQTAADLLEVATRLSPSVGSRITATVRWALSRHWDAAGDLEAAEAELRQGLFVMPDDALLCTQLGWLLAARDAVLEAVETGLSASRAHPEDPGIRALLRYCEDRLEQELRPEALPDGDIDTGILSLGPPGLLAIPTEDEEPSAGISVLQRRLRMFEAAAKAAEQRARAAESTSELQAVELESHRAELEARRAELEARRAELDHLRAEHEALGAAITDAEVRSAGLTADQQILRERIDALTEEAKDLRLRLAHSATLAAALAYQGGWRRARRRVARGGRRILVRLGLPNPLFDAAWYREAYPDVPAGPLRAWLQWRRRGWRDGRDPNPLFDTDWYLAANPDARAAGLDPLAHYLLRGSPDGRDPGPGFDARAYLERYPDVRASGLDPLLHYRTFGAAEGRVATPRQDAG